MQPENAEPTANRRVVVLGGGILGVSSAVHLARSGADVTLVTEAELASGASGRSLSWLNSAGARSGAYHQLRLAGLDRYRTLFAAHPARDWLRFDGGLWWTSAGDADATRARHQHEIDLGYESHLLDRAGLSDQGWGVAPGRPGQLAIRNPGEGWVSLPHLIDELAGELARRGGRIVTGAGRCSVVRAGGRAAGVRAANGASWAADAVVVACGAATPAVLAELGVRIPDASPLSMLVLTRPVDSPVTMVLNTPRAALRPNPGATFALDHDWYADDITEHEDGSCTIDESVVSELAGEASRLLAGGVRLTPASWKLGRKPIPGDGHPVLGELPAVPGCHVAFTHSGATLGLIAGELTAYEVVTGARHPLLAEFRPERFDGVAEP
jgi:glycine/D-amino acid oxidase-like deaminating enzyme